jgi:glycosyltransferase involved in cell wall biosynthesis
MISVCMATKDGARYLTEQLDSILPQLTPNDELIISDDASTDDTVSIIQSYNDHRIKLLRNQTPKGIPKNFEASLTASKGEFIFLTDQDDVWVSTKMKTMLTQLAQYDLVISDCVIVDDRLKIKTDSFFSWNNSGKGLIKNIFRNSYMGCCMAFSRALLDRALPFPKDIPMHDFWIGLIAELYFKVCFTPEILVYHRRHSTNASSTTDASSFNYSEKLTSRYKIIKNLFFHKAYAG